MSEITAHERSMLGCAMIAAGCAAVTLAILGAIAFLIQRNAIQHHAPPGYLGNPQRGRALVAKHGCTACHIVPGGGPEGLVGPPLTDMGRRSYIAGRFPNLPIEMTEWIRHPQEMKPGTAMPDLGVGERDARDMAAYLGTLK